jgi:hypothetical protein
VEPGRRPLKSLSHSFALDWVVTCKSAAEARAAVDAARRILKQLGVELHRQKTRIVHVRHGFEFSRLQNQAWEEEAPSSRKQDS